MFRTWATAITRLLRRRTRSHWLVPRLQELKHHQQVFANAAQCVVSGHGTYTLEDALCSAERMQTQLSELAEHLAVLDVARAIGLRD